MNVPRLPLQKKEILVVFRCRTGTYFYALNRKERKFREIRALESIRPKDFRRCILILGRSFYIFKVVEFPKLKKTLMDKALKINMAEWSPFPASKYFVFSHALGEKVVHLIAICSQPDYDDIVRILRAKNLKIDTVVPETFCYEQFFKGKSKTAAAIRTEDGVELVYVDGSLKESTFIPGPKWIADSLTYFIKRLGPAGSELKEILFVGRTPKAGFFMPEGTAVTPIPADSDIEIVLKGSDFLLSPWVKSFEKRKITLFTPDDVKALKPGLLVVLAGLLIFFASLLFANIKKASVLKKDLAAIKDQSQGLEDKMSRIDSLRKNVAFLHDYIDRSPSQLAVLSELQSCYPEGTFLQRYTFNKDKIEFTGIGSRSSDILARLNASKYFADVKFKSAIEKDPGTGKEKFTIELRLKK
ncbi:MAG: PilN domain-containing protein [Candidatus Aminicenantales bacterium]